MIRRVPMQHQQSALTDHEPRQSSCAPRVLARRYFQIVRWSLAPISNYLDQRRGSGVLVYVGRKWRYGRSWFDAFPRRFIFLLDGLSGIPELRLFFLLAPNTVSCSRHQFRYNPSINIIQDTSAAFQARFAWQSSELANSRTISTQMFNHPFPINAVQCNVVKCTLPFRLLTSRQTTAYRPPRSASSLALLSCSAFSSSRLPCSFPDSSNPHHSWCFFLASSTNRAFSSFSLLRSPASVNHSARALSISSWPWYFSMQVFIASFCARQWNGMVKVRPVAQSANAGVGETC